MSDQPATTQDTDQVDTSQTETASDVKAQAQDVEEKVYHAYEAARRLRRAHIVDHVDFDVVLAGLHAARRFIFNSYSLPVQNEQNWAGRPDIQPLAASSPATEVSSAPAASPALMSVIGSGTEPVSEASGLSAQERERRKAFLRYLKTRFRRGKLHWGYCVDLDTLIEEVDAGKTHGRVRM